ncbi:MarR family winged helix-turn-helix transcriptional regulator [Novosphingobium beihaiensis]|uniref:MarR family transcriptional regulator n=1 Tax=Novosphingobium beihaiensis TaxID=2930389 RepID=A0ABT0BQA8_9SPHN|nr:MarR family transcriptional regulator [Novosphingobium beihaiensis]MCJ2187163.1 MarR family transcriptional regulator [Novosphingobium beihaiensis]
MEADLTPAAIVALRKVLQAAELETRQMAATIGMTPSQVMVLRQIAGHETITPGAVAAALRLGQATVTNIADRLVAAGLVTRTRGEHDKRQVILRLTPEGREKLEASPFPLQLRFSRGYGELPFWEQAMILAGLERLHMLLGEAAAGTQPPASGKGPAEMGKREP